MAKYLVTGGKGFIGSKIVEATDSDIFDIAQGQDILNIEQLQNTTKNIDGIFHCAAKISVPESFTKPDEYYATNVTGTKNIASLGKKIVFSSSAAVYGTYNEKVREDVALKPESPYGQNKVDAEKILSAGPHIALRYFNVYPSRSGVISHFIRLAKENKDIEITGDGSQVRDFIFIDDIVDANIKAMNFKNEKFEVFNIASGVGITIKELAEKIISVCNSSSKIIHIPARKGDIQYSVANIEKAKEMLGWEPKISLEEGLHRII